MKNILFFNLVLISILGCNQPTENKKESNKEINNEYQAKQKIVTEVTTLDQVNDVVATIPSANQITAAIKASGAPFSALTLNNPLNARSYSSNYRKTINLGIYGTDLAYIGVYGRDDLLADHLQVIQSLSKDLDLDHFISQERLEKIKNQGVLTDSIFVLTGDVFKKMDEYLRENERYNTSLLLMIGSWLEAMHIAATVTYNSKFNNETLNAKIGEQKLVLKRFIMLLNNFKNEPLFGQLIDDLAELMVLYNGVELNEEILAKAIRDTTGKYINSKTAEINDTQLAKITIKLNEVRRNIIEPV